MFIDLRIVGAAIYVFSEGVHGPITEIVFDVRPAKGQRLELETGAIFSGQWRDSEKPQIGAKMIVRPFSQNTTSPQEQESFLSYYPSPKSAGGEEGEDDEDGEVDIVEADSWSTIAINQYLEKSVFEDLLTNVKNGLFPSDIYFPHDFDISTKGPITFGHDIDGNEMLWKNTDRDNAHVKLKRVKFRYEVLSEPDVEFDDNGNRIWAAQSEQCALQKRIVQYLDALNVNLQDTNRYLKWITYAVILGLCFMVGPQIIS